MLDWRENIKLEDLDTPYYEIAEILGLPAALKIEEIFRGRQVYFPYLSYMCVDKRKEKVQEEFNGYNITELAIKYNFSERHIRRICQEQIEKEKTKPVDGQIKMW